MRKFAAAFLRILLTVARLAQLVERQPFKLVVVGSSPTVGEFSVFTRFRLRTYFSVGILRMHGSVSEWLRSRTRNPMGSARGGSNPLAVALLLRVPEKFVSQLFLRCGSLQQTRT